MRLSQLGLFASLVLLCSCSPRDFLTRRLAADLIATSSVFRVPQRFELRTGILTNQDYLSPNYLALQHHGWISATQVRCPPNISQPRQPNGSQASSLRSQPSCWDVSLTPSGVETFQSLIAPGDSDKKSLTIPAARREVVAITGIAKQDNSADVEFSWKWVPLNEVGAALNADETQHKSAVMFRRYDDGWRVVESASQSAQPLDESLRSSQAQ